MSTGKWNVDSLKEYIDDKLAHVKEANKDALTIFTTEVQRRLGELNGEAARLAKMQETYYPRQVAEPRHAQHDKDIKDLQLDRALLAGKASQNSFLIVLFFSVIGLLTSLCGLALSVTLAIRLFLL